MAKALVCPPRPPVRPVDTNSIPDELRQLLQWVDWRYEIRRSTANTQYWTTCPKQVDGSNADVTNPKTWSSFDKATECLRVHSHRFDGVGFVFSATDPYFGVDLDACLSSDTGEFKPWPESLRRKCCGKVRRNRLRPSLLVVDTS